MDIGFTEEQELLRDTARKFLDSQCTTKFVREMMATEAAVTAEFWRQLAENGWLGITYPEDDGGSGLGLIDLVVLMEEIGRAVMPGPYPATVLLGGAAIAEAGSPAQRRRMAAAHRRGRGQGDARLDRAQRALGRRRDHRDGARGGRRVHAVRHQDVRARRASRRCARRRGAHPRRQHDGGRRQPVPRAEGHARARRQAAAVDRRDPQDLRGAARQCPRCRRARCSANCTRAGRRCRGSSISAAVALSAEMCGAAQRVLDMTVDYAKMRVAFGKPIGSYQGVKHKCADMLVEIENAKSLTYYAAWAVDEGDPDAALAVSMAKAAASDAGRKVCAAGIQLHGGIGMTWEHDLHLYLKRAKADEVALGDATWHRERIARLMGA